MKIKILILVIIEIFSYCNTQGQVISGKKKSIRITTDKDVDTKAIKAFPDLQVKDLLFTDADRNNIINATEKTNINFKVQNVGKGVANQVQIKVSLKNKDFQGLVFEPLTSIGDIQPNEIKYVSIPITGEMDLKNDNAEIKIEIIEKDGFDAFPVEMKIPTRQFEEPKVIIADAAFSVDDGGNIELNKNIRLKVIVQNIGAGTAENVNVEFKLLNENSFLTGEIDKVTFNKLESGDFKEIDIEFIATRRYQYDNIPVKIDISEKWNKYASDTIASVRFGEVSKTELMVIEGINTGKKEIRIASLSSEVDKQIPINDIKNPNRYALVVGNEDYTSHQRGINTESDILFARNDAEIFKKYLINTLGFEEDNVTILKDATAGAMSQNIELISKIVSKIEGSELIFYYAGHGLPDEKTKASYLIPVDVSGTNLNSAIKLSDIYNQFSRSGAKRITVFLDACFSGGGREAGLLAARAVKIKPKDELLSGNMVVFTASSGEQSALPYKEEQHGMFTYYLLKKLKETRGDVTYGELAKYIQDNVSVQSLKINKKEQDPKVNISKDIIEVWEEWKIK